jgi:hypothetical protein
MTEKPRMANDGYSSANLKGALARPAVPGFQKGQTSANLQSGLAAKPASGSASSQPASGASGTSSSGASGAPKPKQQ